MMMAAINPVWIMLGLVVLFIVAFIIMSVKDDNKDNDDDIGYGY